VEKSQQLYEEIEQKKKAQEDFERQKNDIEVKKNSLLIDIENSEKKASKLKIDLEKEKQKLIEKLGKQSQLININNINSNLRQNDGIKRIKEIIKEKIQDKKKKKIVKLYTKQKKNVMITRIKLI
jgi:hypothetical protein